MSETVDTVKAATVSVELRADSGYEATTAGRISPEQWGRICAIINEGHEIIEPLTKKGSK